MFNGAMSLEEKLEKIQESLMALCNTQTTMCNDQKKLATDQKALAVKVDSLSGTLRDIDQQTRAHNLAILKLEAGDRPAASGKDGILSSKGLPPLSSSTPADDRPPRYFKMEFPTYDGEVDPLSWLNRCDLFFDAQRTAEADKVGIASFHLVGDAQLWYGQYKDAHGTPSWRQLVCVC
jgi:hypothetical protein